MNDEDRPISLTARMAEARDVGLERWSGQKMVGPAILPPQDAMLMTTPLDRPTLTGHPKRLAAMRHYLTGARMYTALRALDFAQRYHVNTRKDGITPEFAHQTSIANYVLTLGPHLLDVEGTVATAWLHDVVEDYDVDIGEIVSLFGNDIAASVHAMSRVIKGRQAASP